MRAVRAIGRFGYDFLVGDDWKIAAGVLVALATLAVVMWTSHLGDAGLAILGALLLAAAFVASLALDLRAHRPK